MERKPESGGGERGHSSPNGADLSPHPHPHQQPRPRKRGSKSTQKSGQSEDGPQDVYYLIPRTVTVLYGPYMFQGMMDYRGERLQGIKAFLEKLGVTVNLIPCLDHVNLCRVWFLEELIFSCKVTDLLHGGDGALDPLCWEAAEKVEKFIQRVLKGLRKQRPAEPETLKKPFCPCFQVDHTAEQGHPHHHPPHSGELEGSHRDSMGTLWSASGKSVESGGRDDLEVFQERLGAAGHAHHRQE